MTIGQKILPILWKVNNKIVHAFEWEGEYRPAARNALKRILQYEVEGEREEYLGRGWYGR